MTSTLSNIHDNSLASPPVISCPGSEYSSSSRKWQGIAGIERTSTGRLFATWYSGGNGEGPGNYVLLVQSDDDGKAWTEPVLVVAPEGQLRAFDPVVWTDPQGRLWLFWAQSFKRYNGRAGVWFVRCDSPDAEQLKWTTPKRICNGIMMNKPTVLSSGEWLLPVSLWGHKGTVILPELADECRANVFSSTDCGESFQMLGGVVTKCRSFDEHMIVERKDGSLWMLIRTRYGIAQSESFDNGSTWTAASPSNIPGPDSRFHIRRLKSGRLLSLNHNDCRQRSHIAAQLSDDDGKTWKGSLLLDERRDVAYPDAVETEDGTIYAIYDYNRMTDREILMAVFNEEHILDSDKATDAKLKILVNKATGELPETD